MNVKISAHMAAQCPACAEYFLVDLPQDELFKDRKHVALRERLIREVACSCCRRCEFVHLTPIPATMEVTLERDPAA